MRAFLELILFSLEMGGKGNLPVETFPLGMGVVSFGKSRPRDATGKPAGRAIRKENRKQFGRPGNSGSKPAKLLGSYREFEESRPSTTSFYIVNSSLRQTEALLGFR